MVFYYLLNQLPLKLLIAQFELKVFFWLFHLDPVDKYLEGWRQPVGFTNFLAEMMFWEFSFFIRNVKKLAVFDKFSNQSFVFLWKHFIVVSCLGSVAKKKIMFQTIFFKKSQSIVISDEKRKFSKHCFSQKVRETNRLSSVF